jgi:hypothetical protein
MARAVTEACDVLDVGEASRLLVDMIDQGQLLPPRLQVRRMVQGQGADHDRQTAGMQRYADSLAGAAR